MAILRRLWGGVSLVRRKQLVVLTLPRHSNRLSSLWMRLRNLLNRLSSRQRPQAELARSDQAKRVRRVLEGRSLHDSVSGYIDAVLTALPASEQLQADTIVELGRHLRVQALEHVVDEPEVFASLWAELVNRFPNQPYLVASHGDALVASGEVDRGTELLLAACESDPSLVYEFGDALPQPRLAAPGRVRLRHQLCCLRAALADALESEACADDCRELYSELLDEHRDNADALAQIREVGQHIAALTETERLPRVFVRRGSTRSE